MCPRRTRLLPHKAELSRVVGLGRHQLGEVTISRRRQADYGLPRNRLADGAGQDLKMAVKSSGSAAARHLNQHRLSKATGHK